MPSLSLEDEGRRTEPASSTVGLVNLVSEIGPDIAEIARRLGQYKESVRYRYKEKIVKRGFQIKANLDYGALGLTRVVLKLRFTDAFAPNAAKIFEAMNSLSYLVGYAGTMPDGLYIAHAGVPNGFVGAFHEVIEGLRDKGVFTSVEFFDCDWFRVVPMRAQCFDFDAGVWDFDWSNPPPADEKAARARISERKKVDRIDLLICKELWKDSARSLTDIKAAIKNVNGVDVNYKTLSWHYSHHVLGQRLITDYSLGWHGMKYNFHREAPEGFAKYDYLGVSLLVRGVSENDKMALRSQLSRLPFLWSEASGSAYYSQLFFPLNAMNEALEYLKGLLKPFGDKGEMFLLDKREMLSFTISYELWDETKESWAFDIGSVVPRLEAAVLEISERTV